MGDYPCGVRGCENRAPDGQRITIINMSTSRSWPCCDAHVGFDASGPICLHRAPLTMRCSPCSSLFDASLTFSKGV